MHPFLRHAFLGQNCAYYTQDFTVKHENKQQTTYPSHTTYGG